jgi:hypothetical protein
LLLVLPIVPVVPVPLLVVPVVPALPVPLDAVVPVLPVPVELVEALEPIEPLLPPMFMQSELLPRRLRVPLAPEPRKDWLPDVPAALPVLS